MHQSRLQTTAVVDNILKQIILHIYDLTQAHLEYLYNHQLS